jgi:hypothetical protein
MFGVWCEVLVLKHHLLLQEQLLLRRRLHVIALLSQLELQLLRTLAVELCSSILQPILRWLRGRSRLGAAHLWPAAHRHTCPAAAPWLQRAREITPKRGLQREPCTCRCGSSLVLELCDRGLQLQEKAVSGAS